MNTSQLIQDFYLFIEKHKLSIYEFCRITSFDIIILNKILNNELYVSIFDYFKLAQIIDSSGYPLK